MRRAVAAAVLVLVAAAACGEGVGPDAAGEREPSVVASFYPLAEAASRVGGDRVTVRNLTPAGTEPHDLELSSHDVERVEDADLVLYLGGGFQPGVERAVRRTKGQAIDVLSGDLALIEDHRDEEGHLGTDPHIWLDPTLMRRVAERVRDALVEGDPANRASYEGNAQAYAHELDDLDAAFRQGLDQCDRRLVVTSHAAFGYLARRYNLRQEAIVGLAPEAEPDPRRLAGLVAKVRAEGVTTVFHETFASPRVAQTLAREAGVKTAVLNPIEGLSEEQQRQGKSYGSVMRDNLVALRAALGCR